MAREGFQRLSLLSGERAAEYHVTEKGSGYFIRGEKGRFVSYKKGETGLELGNIKAMFDNWIQQGRATAEAKTPAIADTDYLTGVRQVMYRANFIEAVYKSFPGLAPLVRTEISKELTMLLAAFVEDEVKPRAMQIIDEEVYSGSLGKTGANIAGRGEFTDTHAERLEDRAENIELQTGSKEKWNSSGEHTDAKRKQVHLTFAYASRVAEMKSQAGFHFSKYAGATGILRQALYAGIHATPTSIIIGVDESLFPERPFDPEQKGRFYWQFVEYGHKYVWKHPKTGKRTVMPFTEPEKPFLRKLNEWMRTEGAAKLEQRMFGFIAAVHQLITNALKLEMGAALSKSGLDLKEFTGSKIGTFNPRTGVGTGFWGRQVQRGREGMKGQYRGKLT